MKTNTYVEQIRQSFLTEFNKARKQFEAEFKQKPFKMLHSNDNKIHAKICVN
jgi:hypothetical protein